MTSVTRHLPSFVRVPAEALVGQVSPFGSSKEEQAHPKFRNATTR